MNTYPTAPADTINFENPDPQAIFDISLGKHVAFIDFDTQAYREHLLERGIPEEQLAGHTVRFLSQNWFSLREGYCDTAKNELGIYVSSSSTEERLDEVVRHEAEHLVSLTQRPRKLHTSRLASTAFNLAGLTCASVAASAFAVVQGNEKLYEISQTSTYAYAALSGLFYLMHWYNPEERRARAAEEVVSSTFMTFERQ